MALKNIVVLMEKSVTDIDVILMVGITGVEFKENKPLVSRASEISKLTSPSANLLASDF